MRVRWAPADVFGACLFATAVAVEGAVLLHVRAPDVQVYHLAIPHLLSDDVYEHYYPDLASPYTYPPSALLLLGLLAVPLEHARVIIFAALVASVWITARLVVRSAGRGSGWDSTAVTGAVAAVTILSLPLFLAAGLGQAAPVVMALSAWGMLGASSRLRGSWVGTAAAIKLTPAAFALHWWTIGRSWDATVAAASFVVWTALGWGLMPVSSGWYFLGGVMRAPQDYTNISNQALSGIAARAGWETSAQRVSVVVVSAVLLLVALVVARRVQQAGWSAAAVALVGVWSGVCAPLAWIHAFGWWVPLAAAIALYGRTKRDIVVAVLMVLWPYVPLVTSPGSGPSGLLNTAGYAIGAVLATAWLWWRVGARPSPVVDVEPNQAVVATGTTLVEGAG